MSSKEAEALLSLRDRVRLKIKRYEEDGVDAAVEVSSLLGNYQSIVNDTRLSTDIREKSIKEINTILSLVGEKQLSGSIKQMDKINYSLDGAITRLQKTKKQISMRSLNKRADLAISSNQEMTDLNESKVRSLGNKSFSEAFKEAPGRFTMADAKKGVLSTGIASLGLGPLDQAFGITEKLDASLGKILSKEDSTDEEVTESKTDPMIPTDLSGVESGLGKVEDAVKLSGKDTRSALDKLLDKESDILSESLHLDQSVKNTSNTSTNNINNLTDTVLSGSSSINSSVNTVTDSIENVENGIDKVVKSQHDIINLEEKQLSRGSSFTDKFKSGKKKGSDESSSLLGSIFESRTGGKFFRGLINKIPGMKTMTSLFSKIPGITGGLPGRVTGWGSGIAGSAGRGVSSVTGTVAGSVAEKGVLGSAGNLLKGGGKLLAKAAVPLMLANMAWDAGSGFMDKESAKRRYGDDGIGSRIANGSVEMLSGMTLGIVDADTIASTLKTLGEKLEFLFQPIFEVIDTISGIFTDGFAVTMSRKWSEFKEWISGIWSDFSTMFPNVTGFITDTIQAVSDMFTGISTYIDENLVKPVNEAIDTTVAFLTDNIFSPLEDSFSGLVSFITDNVIQPISDGFSLISEIFTDNVLTPIQDVFSTISDGFSKLVDKLASAPVIGPFFKGMKSAGAAVVNTVTTAPASVANYSRDKAAQVKALFTSDGDKKARADSLIKVAKASGITDPKELGSFVAQMDHETGGFKYMRELGSGSQYEGRKDLGNTQSGDGMKYKGRGYIQLTGRANYEKYGKALGIDLVNNPDLAENPEIASKIAIMYWKDRKLGDKAKAGDTVGVTKGINGGTNGLDNRLALTDAYVKKFSTESDTKSTISQKSSDSTSASLSTNTVTQKSSDKKSTGSTVVSTNTSSESSPTSTAIDSSTSLTSNTTINRPSHRVSRAGDNIAEGTTIYNRNSRSTSILSPTITGDKSVSDSNTTLSSVSPIVQVSRPEAIIKKDPSPSISSNQTPSKTPIVIAQNTPAPSSQQNYPPTKEVIDDYGIYFFNRALLS